MNNNNNKSLAFCFLIRDKLVFSELWEFYFQQLQSLGYKVVPVIHCAADIIEQAHLKQYCVPVQPSTWMQTLLPQLELLKKCQELEVDYAFLLSESCVPIVAAKTFAQYMDRVGWQSCLDVQPVKKHLPTYSYKQNGRPARVIYCNTSYHRSHEQWWGLNATTINILLKQNENEAIVKRFVDCFADNEHWIGTTAAMFDIESLFFKKCLTYTNWGAGGAHPRKFERNIDGEDWNKAQNGGYLFLRKCTSQTVLQPVCHVIAPDGQLRHLNNGIASSLSAKKNIDLVPKNETIVDIQENEAALNQIPVVGFWHIYCANDWKKIVAEQLFALSFSGLEFSALFVTVNTSNVEEYKYVKDLLTLNFAKNIYISHETENEYEFPALRLLKTFCDKYKQLAHILYFHTKGAGSIEIYKKYWRYAMEQIVIWNFKKCRQKLLTCDAVGIGWREMGKISHFSGNFWWASSLYIKKLPVFDTYVDNFRNYDPRGHIRLSAEFYIGAANPKIESFGGKNLQIWNPRYYIAKNIITMNNHLNVINTLIESRKFKSYLQLGVCDAKTFAAIKCDKKTATDAVPGRGTFTGNTDAFFEQNQEKFDLIFIDDWHDQEQVMKDIDNAFKCLNAKGIVIVHDCYPPNEWLGRPASEYKAPDGWCGDAWRAVAYNAYLCDYKCSILTADYGIAIFDTTKKNKPRLEEWAAITDFSYANMANILKPYIVDSFK